MGSVNKVILVGNLGRDAELREGWYAFKENELIRIARRWLAALDIEPGWASAMADWLAPALAYIPQWISWQRRITDMPGIAVAVAQGGKLVQNLACLELLLAADIHGLLPGLLGYLLGALRGGQQVVAAATRVRVEEEERRGLLLEMLDEHHEHHVLQHVREVAGVEGVAVVHVREGTAPPVNVDT